MDKVPDSAVSLSSMLARFSEHWAPKKIAEINDYDVIHPPIPPAN